MSNNLTLSKKQSEFLQKVLAGENVSLSGKAGTGKSFIVKLAIDTLKQQGKKVMALAPTGIAANNIGGQTLHSMFSLDPFGVLTYAECKFLKGEKRRMLNKTDVIFIDEVSMLRPDILDAVNWTLVKNGCRGLREIQIVFIGDMKQLPVVVDDNMRSVLLSIYQGCEWFQSKIFDKLNVDNVDLDVILRQSDQDFINSLNVVREGGKSEYFRRFVGGSPKGIILAPHNSTVQQYNIDGLASVHGHEHNFHATVTGNVKAGDFNVDPLIKVKDGCKIMYLVNSKNNPLVNGTLGTFKSYGSNYFITVGGVDYALEKQQFTKKEYVYNEDKDRLELREIGSIEQFPIRLAYALSIHKSQGMTFQEVTVDLTMPCFAPGQMYVALSRVTSPEGLTIITR